MSKEKIRVAIVGVGNCASALVQGLEFYRDAPAGEPVPGLMHVNLGPYHVSDIEVVAAFDVDGKKVGRDLSEAIFTEPNNTIRFADVPPLGVDVLRGPTLDGLGQYYREMVTESTEEPVDVTASLGEAGAQVVVNYLPVGSEIAAKHYAQAALEAGAAYVNCMPVFIASDREWARRFHDAGMSIELKLEVWDSPNSAGIVIDAVRCARLAMDRGVAGPLIGPSAYFMKSPPVQFSDDAAREMVEEFILGNGASKQHDWSAFFDAQTAN